MFDVVLIDSPPVLAVVDSLIISSTADSTVLVIQAGKTTRKPFLRTLEELRRTSTKIIGVLFNGVKEKDIREYSPYYYLGSQYYCHGEEEKTGKT